METDVVACNISAVQFERGSVSRNGVWMSDLHPRTQERMMSMHIYRRMMVESVLIQYTQFRETSSSQHR